ncbi:MAG: diguanylate cyclase [Deltaproteobacteria bacterium]|nr:diguanylate cyclase [Deltaproteobacteria bacterium]
MANPTRDMIPSVVVEPQENGSTRKKPTYEELEIRVEELEREAYLQAETEAELKAANQELESNSRQMEAIVERANQMAVESEITSVELNQIFNTTADGIWVVDRDFTLLRVNRALLQVIGKNEQETVGSKCYELFSIPLCRGPDCPLVRIMKGKERIECDIEKERPDGAVLPFLLTATPLRGFDGQKIGIVGNFTNITDRKQAEAMLQEANRKLQQLAIIDGLTQLANRRKFDESLELEWKRFLREKSPLSLIMCDVDCFKIYNDTYGHQLGDDCLRAVARVIQTNAKRPSDVATRYGGEEFAVILPNTDSRGASHVAETIRTGVEELKIDHTRSPVNRHVTLSLGVATMVPSRHSSPSALVKAADQALYSAKKCGRNRVVQAHSGGEDPPLP